MAGATADFTAFLEKLTFNAPQLPIYLNATVAPETNAEICASSCPGSSPRRCVGPN